MGNQAKRSETSAGRVRPADGFPSCTPRVLSDSFDSSFSCEHWIVVVVVVVVASSKKRFLFTFLPTLGFHSQTGDGVCWTETVDNRLCFFVSRLLPMLIIQLQSDSISVLMLTKLPFVF